MLAANIILILWAKKIQIEHDLKIILIQQERLNLLLVILLKVWSVFF